MKFPEQFEQSKIDLEVDFGNKGGIQRFKTIADLQGWLNKEREFWGWIDKIPAKHRQNLSDIINNFPKILNECRTHLSGTDQDQWKRVRPQITKMEEIWRSFRFADARRAGFEVTSPRKAA